MNDLLYIYGSNVLVNVIRYVICCGIVVGLTMIPGIRRQPIQKMVNIAISQRSLRHEMTSSFVTILVVAAFGVAMILMYRAGLSAIGGNDFLKSAPNVILSVVALILLFDFYFYMFHRLLHVMGVERSTHDVHHFARPTTAWGALAFSPFEAAIVGLFFLLSSVTVPMHPITMQIFMFIVFFQSALHHSGYRIYPQNWARIPILGLWASANHHQLHHRSGRYNFGLYFVWWDRVFKTEHPDYRI